VLDENMHLIEIASSCGTPLGITEEIALDAQTVTIPRGGLVVIYSDGLSEAEDVKNNQFGVERLANELPTVSHLPAAQVCAHLWKRVQEFGGGQPQSANKNLLAFYTHLGVCLIKISGRRVSSNEGINVLNERKSYD